MERPKRIPFLYIVLGIVVFTAAIFIVPDILQKYEEDRAKKEQLAQAYLDSLRSAQYKEEQRRKSQWRLIDYVASGDRKSGAKSFAVYSPEVKVEGASRNLKVWLAVKWTPALQFELFVLHFSHEPYTFSAKYDLNNLMDRTIDLPMTWMSPDTSYTHTDTVRLRFFPKEGEETLGFVIPDRWNSARVITGMLRQTYETLFLDFSEWGYEYAEIDLAGAEYEINRMREQVKSMYR